MKKSFIITIGIIALALILSTVVAAANKTSDQVTAPANKTSDQVTAPVNEVDGLAQSQIFKNHGLEIKEQKEATKIDKVEAITQAQKIVGSAGNKAEKVTAVLVKFTDKETPKVPESNITLQDYPVWIVTFHGVNMPRHGKKGGNTSDVYADSNVVIDASTGAFIEMIAGPHEK
jgi:hypothetical protein